MYNVHTYTTLEENWKQVPMQCSNPLQAVEFQMAKTKLYITYIYGAGRIYIIHSLKTLDMIFVLMYNLVHAYNLNLRIGTHFSNL